MDIQVCGTLKHSDQRMKLGDKLTAREYKTGKIVSGTWSGFMKDERLEWWLQQTKLLPVEVKADAFIEGKYEFDVPSRCILAYQLQSEVTFQGKIIGRPGEIKLLTRAPMNSFEKTIHARWPVVKVGANRKLFAFQPWDVKGMLPVKQMDIPYAESAAEE